MYTIRKSAQSLKNMLFLHFITTFQNLAFEVDSSWTKRVVKLILETRNVNDVCM